MNGAIRSGRGTYICIDCLKPKKWSGGERCPGCSNRHSMKKYWNNQNHRKERGEALKNNPKFQASRNSSIFQTVMKSPEHRKKLSLGQKKRYETRESRKKLGERMKKIWARPDVLEKHSGPNNHNWHGGVHRPYGPEFNRDLKTIIRKRDDYLCQNPRCYLPENGRKHAVHHIDYDRKNCNPVNLITLCTGCHTKTSIGDRNYWGGLYSNLQELRGIHGN